MNEQNLVPLNQRAKSEQRKIQQKGWETSAKVRKMDAEVRRWMGLLVGAIMRGEDGKEIIDPATGERMTFGIAINKAQLRKALDGDTAAYNAIMKVLGVFNDTATVNQQINVDGTQSLSIREARAKLLGLDESNDNDKQ